MFRGRLSDLTLNALLVMNRHERGGLIAQVLRRFVTHQEQAAGQVEVTATSATELPEDQRTQIADLAAKLSGRSPIMEWSVDPDIIGGLVLLIGDVRYDHSVRRHLNAARRRLFERSDRGLGIAVQS
jgi:F-type H+-transporting ATPase subunit delta